MINITPEELVRYIYNETSPQKTEKIRSALQTDWNLRDTYEKLVGTEKELSKLKFSPRVETVNKILAYASKKHMPV
jgi:hypothetical protein